MIITLITSHTLTDHFSENNLLPGDGYEFVMIKIILSFIIHNSQLWTTFIYSTSYRNTFIKVHSYDGTEKFWIYYEMMRNEIHNLMWRCWTMYVVHFTLCEYWMNLAAQLHVRRLTDKVRLKGAGVRDSTQVSSELRLRL